MSRFSLQGREFYCRGKFIKICGLYAAWYEPVDDPQPLIEALKKAQRRIHIFTFFQRIPHVVPRFSYRMVPYGVAVLELTTYEDWWTNSVGKNVRQAVKRSRKLGIEVRVTELDADLVAGISAIYNESPVRQGRPFPHYGDSLEKVRSENGTYPGRSLFLGAYHGNELVGFARIVFEDEFADLLQFLAKISHRDKSVNNALLAKAVEVCTARGVRYLAYGDLGFGTLDDFKRHNGFVRMDLPSYYVPLNSLGAIALRLGLHRGVSGLLPGRTLRVLKDLRRRWHILRTT